MQELFSIQILLRDPDVVFVHHLSKADVLFVRQKTNILKIVLEV